MSAAEALLQPIWGLPPPLAAPAARPARAEVAIVGGGITGVALLVELIARGVDAVLLERHLVGSGATGRNAGFLLAGVADNYSDAVRRYGRDVAAAAWHFSVENHEVLAGSEAAGGARHARRGSSTVAIGEAEAAALDESLVLLREDGFAVEPAPPPPWALRMLVNPGDGEIDPLALVGALAGPVASRIHERNPALAVIDGTNSATVELATGSVEASLVVLACNAWIGELLPAARVRPVRAQMLAAPGPPALIERPAYAERGHRYWRQRSDGTVLVGGFRHRAEAEEVGFELDPTAAVQMHLDAQLRALGAPAPASHRWCGTMGFSHDGLPVVGRVPGSARVLVCGGYTGHGMGFAMLAARRLAAHMVAGEELPGWLDAARVPAGGAA